VHCIINNNKPLLWYVQPAPFWEKAKPIVEDMRNKGPNIYEKWVINNESKLDRKGE
jgi:hypothetical protein